MSLPLVIYIIEVLCQDYKGAAFILGVSVIFSITYKVLRAAHEGTDKEKLDRFGIEEWKVWDKVLDAFSLLPKVGVLSFILLIMGIFIPSKDAAYTMLAAYGVEEIIANEDVVKLGDKSLEVLNKALDSYLEESK